MYDKLLPGNYAWQQLNSGVKEGIIMSYHLEMLDIGFGFSIEQVQDIFMEVAPVITVNKKNEVGICEGSRPAMEYFISLEFHKKWL